MSLNFVSIQDFTKAFKEKRYHQVIKNGEEKIIEFSFFGYEILPAFSSILIYFVMLTVLIFRPNGIFNKQ